MFIATTTCVSGSIRNETGLRATRSTRECFDISIICLVVRSWFPAEASPIPNLVPSKINLGLPFIVSVPPVAVNK